MATTTNNLNYFFFSFCRIHSFFVCHTFFLSIFRAQRYSQSGSDSTALNLVVRQKSRRDVIALQNSFNCWNCFVVSLPVNARSFKFTEHIVTTKLSFHNLLPVHEWPKGGDYGVFESVTASLNTGGRSHITNYEDPYSMCDNLFIFTVPCV
jgi:hypothetical protein